MMNDHKNQIDISPLPNMPTTARRQYRQIDVDYNPVTRMLSTYLKPIGANCFNLGILEELRHNDSELEKNGGQYLFNEKLCPVDYYVMASRNPHVFNFGGDLALFIMLIKSRDRDALLHYAKLCVDCIFARIKNYHSSTITISMVKGDALGGGFETALTSNIIIAEHNARMGFPEIIFNLFPGMGAYSLLARRVGIRLAEELMSSGNIYQAQELQKMGIIDILVPNGEGDRALSDLVRQQGKRRNGLRAIYECRSHYNQIEYSELMDITKIWVSAALRLTDKDLQMMTRLVRSQIRQKEMEGQEKIASESSAIELAAA